MSGIIYLITNKVNSKSYVGKTTQSLNSRYKDHLYHSKTGQTHLYRAMRKHGVENFSVTIIEETEEDLNIREKYWISTIVPEYNMTEGGDGGDTSHSPNFRFAIKKVHEKRSSVDYATFGMLGKTQSQKFHDAIKESNCCAVICEGVEFSSVSDAEKHYGTKSWVRKRLDDPKFPEFYRLRERTRRK